MNLATGVFRSVDTAEDAFRALQQANFSADQIGLVACDRNKGEALSSDLHRAFRPDDTPSSVTSNAVYCKFPDDYTETIHASELPDQAVDWYHHHLDSGDVLVVVQVGDRMQDADRIIHDHGGILYPESFTDMSGTTTKLSSDVRGTEATASTIYVPIIEEEVILEKTSHRVGEVDVTPETTTRSVDVPASVMHEEIRVERRTLDRPMSVDEYRAKVSTESGTVRMPVVEEELRVMKRPVIREEMVITRVPVQETKTIHEEIQRTEPRLNTEGDVNVERPGEEKRRPAA